MTGPMVGVYGIVVMFAVLFLLRIPAGFTMAIVGFLGVAYVTSFKAAFGMIGTDMWNIFSNYGLTVIPMFILVGEFVHYAGLQRRPLPCDVQVVRPLQGRPRHNHDHGLRCLFRHIGQQHSHGCDDEHRRDPGDEEVQVPPQLNAGSVAAGATLGVLIPPSIVLVVYGLYTGQSIGKLFFGNVIPSAILTVLIAATVFFICWRHPDWGPAAERSTWKERFKALPEIIDILILFAIIMYALFTGVVTATEAAAASSTLALIICLIRRKLSWDGLHLKSDPRYAAHLLPRLHDRRGRRHLRPVPHRDEAPLRDRRAG